METNINISVSVALLLMILAGCSSGSDDPNRLRIQWHKTAEYKTCRADEEVAYKAAVESNKAAWKVYDSKLAKAKSEYPKKLEQYEKELKNYEQNGGLIPLVVVIPEMSVFEFRPSLLPPQGQCFNPPKNFQG